MAYLVDTGWVVDHRAGLPAVHALIATLLPDGIAISIITYVEVYEGIAGSRGPRQSDHVFREFLRGIDVLAISRGVARRAALVRLDLRRRRRPITHRALGLLIAATALERGPVLVSRNTGDYADIPGLRLYQPT